MKVIVFGASGMVGQGALRECLVDPDVTHVLAVVRKPLELPASFDALPGKARLTQLTHADMSDFEPIADRLAGYDACLFCLGTSSVGMKEPEYRKITFDLTMAVAKVLARVSPDITFEYVSGAGTDSSERGRSMWARVKGEVENTLLRMFPRGYALRPAAIMPKHGIRSRMGWLRAFYVVFTPLAFVLRPVGSGFLTDTEALGRAMLHIARHGADKRVLENRDLVAIAKKASAAPAPR